GFSSSLDQEYLVIFDYEDSSYRHRIPVTNSLQDSQKYLSWYSSIFFTNSFPHLQQ
ncbi:hypothetical protein HRED_09607, partial [Candidatus Haloredivivus sp. G17]